MKDPISYRNGIPFFCHKSNSAFQADIYERYDDMVLRQVALHFADELWGNYPMQGILDFANDYYLESTDQNILEIGCGVGRWIALLAKRFPESTCWGIDYSYQMLKQANNLLVLGNDITVDLSNKGFNKTHIVQGDHIKNLKFGLANAAELPFPNNSQNLIVNSFLLDRLEEPVSSLGEMYRVLTPNGRLIMVTPLNFKQSQSWDALYPVSKIHDVLADIGYKILKWKEDILINEPLDVHGNLLQWKCLGVVAVKE